MAFKEKIRKEKKRNMHSIRRQTLVPLVLLSIVIAIYTAVVLAFRFSGFYLNDHYVDADRIAKYTVSELTDYRQIAWLFDYWEAHCEEMDLIFERHDPRFAAKEAVLREKCPTLTELQLMTREELEAYNKNTIDFVLREVREHMKNSSSGQTDKLFTMEHRSSHNLS